VLLVLLDELDAVVLRAAVNNEPFEVRVLLRDDGLERRLQVVALVEAGGDDGDLR
jgi:hypothetical protein